jgi:predicted TIM-barrel fold metal-dependent hydrolase
MPVIDIDAHFIEPFGWMEKSFPKLASKLPGFDFGKTIGDLVAGEFIAQIPKEARPSPDDLLPEVYKRVIDHLPSGPISGTELDARIDAMDEEIGGPFQAMLRRPGAANGDDRIKLMDANGIDIQFLNPSMGLMAAETAKNQLNDRDLERECLAAYNSWTMETVHGHTDRLLPVTYVTLDNFEWALKEIKRMHAMGSRAVCIPAHPVGGRSLAHPDFEPLWTLAEDLGMAIVYHVAFSGRTVLENGWANAGADHLLASMMTYRSQQAQIPTLALTAMIFGGVFERHPHLVVMAQELETEWLPSWLHSMDTIVKKNPFSRASAYKFSLKPSEFAQRNIFVSGLPNDLQPVQPAFDNVPQGIIAFATDYPHMEGGPIDSARQFYEGELKNYSSEVKDDFFGNAVARAMALN